MATRNNIFSEIVVGAFMVMVLAALIVFTALTAGVDFFTGKGRKTLTFAFDNVAGLRAQDVVVLRGMPVGKIKSLTLTEKGVLVEALVDDHVDLREGYSATVRATSLLGGNQLVLEEGTGPDLDDSLTHAGSTPRDMLADVGAAVADVRRFINSIDTSQINAILADIAGTAAGLNKIITRVEAGEGTVGKLLSTDDTIYNDIAAITAELRVVMARVNTFTEKIAESDGSIQRLLTDNGELYDTLGGALKNIETVTARLRDGEGTLGKLLSSDATLYNDVAAIAADLKIFAAQLKEGNGTLGKLISDPSLYNNVEGLILDARGALDNFRETTPVTTFGSLIMGGL